MVLHRIKEDGFYCSLVECNLDSVHEFTAGTEVQEGPDLKRKACHGAVTLGARPVNFKIHTSVAE